MGGGIGGLAAAALLGRAGHEVTLLEANGYLGGKSRRIILDGQRVDTGPAIITFPGVWEEFLRRWNTLGDGSGTTVEEVAGFRLRRLSEMGTYYYKHMVSSLPVHEGHPWRGAWERFVSMHGGLGSDITRLLTSDWYDPRLRPALWRLLRLYGARPTTKSYLDSLDWLPEGLRQIIAIHTLNAGVGPARTPALFASMPAVMATDGVWAPEGGVYELVRALARLAQSSGVELRTEEPVYRVEPGQVTSAHARYTADVVVSGLDPDRLEGILVPRKKVAPKKLTCSGVMIYATLKEELPEKIANHGVVLPSEPTALYRSLEAQEEPEETMAFVDYYRAGELYPNESAVLALGLTAPANGREYDLEDAFVAREMERVGRTMDFPRPIVKYFGEYEILHPLYFGGWGSAGGALYGASRPFWMSGPLHRPSYSNRRRPWLWRVGASVHPGGGIPAVLGGVMISTTRLLRFLSR